MSTTPPVSELVGTSGQYVASAGSISTCPVCAHEDKHRTSIREYFSPIVNERYHLFACSNCDLHFWHPRVLMKEIYEGELQEDYIAFHIGRPRGIGGNIQPFFETKTFRSGRLLDIGCGEGTFLQEAQKLGYECWGLDFDSKSIAVARNARGLQNVHSSSFPEFVKTCLQQNIFFDVITFFEVLEHQDEPIPFLDEIKKILKPNGFIAGSVPNRNRFLANYSDKAFGFGDCPPHHFTRWSTRSLGYLLSNSGFESQIVDCAFFTIMEAAYWWQRLTFRNTINRARMFVKRRLASSKRDAHLPVDKILSMTHPESRGLSASLSMLNRTSKLVEYVAFVPIALATLPLLNRNGRNLYFQAHVRK